MDRFTVRFAVVLCAAAVVFAAPALADEHPGAIMSPEEMAKMMEEWTKFSTPSEHHKQLDVFVGTWDTVTRMWMSGPGSPPTESKGTSEIKWVLDGRFIMEEHEGDMMGQPYNGIGFTGYDNFRNMYAATWINNQSTAMLTMTGMHDPAGKTWTFYGEMDEPMLSVHGRTVKSDVVLESPDKYVFTIYDLHAGDDYRAVEITYNRVK